MKKAEMIKVLEHARANQLAYVEASKGCDNPQVIALSNKAQGAHDAFDAVLVSLKGCGDYLLNVYVRGHIMV